MVFTVEDASSQKRNAFQKHIPGDVKLDWKRQMPVRVSVGLGKPFSQATESFQHARESFKGKRGGDDEGWLILKRKGKGHVSKREFVF